MNENNNPLVSVIIPVYNHENYVQTTIKSIINQTYKNIELIVIDDGSKDDSFSRILELKQECDNRFSNVIMETKENEGTCRTYNKLISRANGEYIYLIASDDISKPTAIEKEVEFLENNSDYVLVVGNQENIDKDGKRIYFDKNAQITYDENSAVYKTTEFLQEKRKINFKSSDFGEYSTFLAVGNYLPNGYLVRKATLDFAGNFTPEAPLEDYWEMMQLSKYGKFKFLDEILFSYRLHGENTVTQNKKMRMMARKTLKYEFEILKSLKKTGFENCLPNVRKTYYLYKFFGKLAKFYKKYELKQRYNNLKAI
ncbi:glycosyltransferase family 2 protein [bacterium]|nr:glycosyltransferase family 2 protein [bacterium]